MSRFVLVLTRDAVPDLSAAAIGALTGRLALWVAALRRWRLLVAAAPAPGPGTVRGCLLVSATDQPAARRLAASCPVGGGTAVAVLPLQEYR